MTSLARMFRLREESSRVCLGCGWDAIVVFICAEIMPVCRRGGGQILTRTHAAFFHAVDDGADPSTSAILADVR